MFIDYSFQLIYRMFITCVLHHSVYPCTKLIVHTLGKIKGYRICLYRSQCGMDSEENELAYYAVQGLNGSSSIPDSPSSNSSQREKRSRSRSRSPSSTYQRTVPGGNVSMNHQTKKIKPHTEGSCFTEETRLAFLERLNSKSSRTRLMTQEKFDSIIKYMREGLEGPVPEGFSKAERTTEETEEMLCTISL